MCLGNMNCFVSIKGLSYQVATVFKNRHPTRASIYRNFNWLKKSLITA